MFRFFLFFLIALVLLESGLGSTEGGPALEGGTSACAAACCGGQSENDDTPDSRKACNPFQCHTCCFGVFHRVLLPLAPAWTVFQAGEALPYLSLYHFSASVDVWQPPRFRA